MHQANQNAVLLWDQPIVSFSTVYGIRSLQRRHYSCTALFCLMPGKRDLFNGCHYCPMIILMTNKLLFLIYKRWRLGFARPTDGYWQILICFRSYWTGQEIKPQIFPDTQKLMWLGESGGNDQLWDSTSFQAVGAMLLKIIWIPNFQTASCP